MTDEGPTECQKDLWEVQSDPPSRARHGHLWEPAP